MPEVSYDPAQQSDSDAKKTSTPKYFHQSSQPDGQCGCGPSWSPSWLQFLRWPPLVVFFIWIVCVPTFMNRSYFGATLTSVERQFGLSSSQSALLASLPSISGAILVVFITYIADRISKPRVLALSFVFVALGNICTALPHFLSEPLDTDALLDGKRVLIGSLTGNSSTQNLCLMDDAIEAETNSTNSCEEEPVGFRGLIWWAVIGQILLGVGFAAINPIFITYIDDLAGRNRQRFVIYYTIYALIYIWSPACGFFLGSIAEEYYVDFERIPDGRIPVLSQSDPRWIGAWWVGFAIVGVYTLLAAVPMALLPKDPSVNVRDGTECVRDGDMKNDETDADLSNSEAPGDGNEKNDDSNLSNDNPTSPTNRKVKDNFLAHVKDFISVIIRILRRPLLIFYMLFSLVELACIGVFTTFVVKYFILQFGISGKRAALINGAVLVPASMLGLTVSGFISRRLTLKQCGVYLLVNNILTVVLLIIATFVGCKNPPIAGVNKEYATSLERLDCAFDCGCNPNIFRPVCSTENISYLSPCNAGCKIGDLANDTNLSTYSDCTCVQALSNSSFDDDSEFGRAKSGLCDREDSCETKVYIAVFLFGLLLFCRLQDNTPLNLIVLGNCETELRTTMFGVSKFIYILLGTFPTPIYFGAIVNTTCVLWQYTCGERAACWLYDIVKLRYAFFGINIALRVLQIPICIGIILTVKEFLTKSPSDDARKNDYKMGNRIESETNKQHNSISYSPIQ
ncbi:solute carrier organic anion transporter family member 2A1-like [Amphiura filiformis]|uniref:solute carrier organic anion transporter family member 2A1-like n=1 Tax=Amphiura filiformis TaxID=82378 RepID=UPI003B216194